MAGNYPDVPGPRIAYDLNGSAGFSGPTGSTPTALTAGELAVWNNDNNDFAGQHATTASATYGLIFPVLCDLVGIFFGCRSDGFANTPQLQWSANSTNGLDGTWTTVGNITSPAANSALNPTTIRTGIMALSLTGVKAVRCNQSTGAGGADCSIFHVYGNYASGQNPDRLRLWHPTLDQEITGAYFDFSDLARTASATKQFRVKNNSATLTANSPALSFSFLTDATPTLVGQFQVSSDNSTYANTLTLANLAPGAISPVTYLRCSVSATAALSLWSGRVKAVAASWV